MSKDSTSKRTENKAKKKERNGIVSGILGVALLLVLVSIAYSCVVIWGGTTGLIPKIMLAPQAAFGVLIAGWAFIKIFK